MLSFVLSIFLRLWMCLNVHLPERCQGNQPQVNQEVKLEQRSQCCCNKKRYGMILALLSTISPVMSFSAILPYYEAFSAEVWTPNRTAHSKAITSKSLSFMATIMGAQSLWLPQNSHAYILHSKNIVFLKKDIKKRMENTGRNF